MLAWLGTSFTFLMTALGAATVFFFARAVCERAQGALLGFASGVMTAASVWSLILPAIEQTAAEGRLPPFLPAAAGIVLGALLLALLDEFTRQRGGERVTHSDFLLLSAITLHNIPEGMAVGLAFALAADGEGLAGAAALALGMERAEPDIMSRPPRSARESIFAHGVGFDCVYQGVMCAVLTLAAFFIGHYMEYGVWTVTNSPDGTTMAFLTLSMAEIFHSFNMRAHRASLFTLRTPNWALVGAAAASLALTTLCIYVPFLANAFDFTPISAAEYAVAMGLAFLVLPIVEGVKCVQRAAAKRRARA